MATRFIGLSGYARSGKDTVSSFLTTEWGYKRFAFADKLKEAVTKLNPIIDLKDGWTVQQATQYFGIEKTKERYPEYRRLLQVMGTEIGREMFGDNIWVDLALNSVEPRDLAVFTDCRFPNEARAIKERGGEVWRVVRPGYGPINGHASETSLDDWTFDRIILNNGSLDKLGISVSGLMSEVL